MDIENFSNSKNKKIDEAFIKPHKINRALKFDR